MGYGNSEYRRYLVIYGNIKIKNGGKIMDLVDKYLVENKKWKYQDGRGVWQTGEFQKSIEDQGSDITYAFKNDKTGRIDLVSGSRLKKAKPIN